MATDTTQNTASALLKDADMWLTFVREERLANIKALCPVCRHDPPRHLLSVHDDKLHHCDADGSMVSTCPASVIWMRDRNNGKLLWHRIAPRPPLFDTSMDH